MSELKQNKAHMPLVVLLPITLVSTPISLLDWSFMKKWMMLDHLLPKSNFFLL